MEIDKTNRNNLKGYFQRGKIPTEQNFAEFIDALRFNYRSVRYLEECRQILAQAWEYGSRS